MPTFLNNPRLCFTNRFCDMIMMLLMFVMIVMLRSVADRHHLKSYDPAVHVAGRCSHAEAPQPLPDCHCFALTGTRGARALKAEPTGFAWRGCERIQVANSMCLCTELCRVWCNWWCAVSGS